MNWECVGYFEFGYRMFIQKDTGVVERKPIPYVFTQYNNYWW